VAQISEFEGVGDEEIKVDAESISYDRKVDTVSAEGDVVVQRGATVLRADNVELDRRTNEATAVGGAIVTSPIGVLQADRIQMDLDDETGTLQNGSIDSQRFGFRLAGERIEKGIGQTYHIENGRFTTCRCGGEAPPWSISGRTMDVALDGYGVVRGATFNIRDVPVLYLPKASIPVYRERKSGFLLPRVGFSNRRGVQIVQPYYWAIDKSQDLTTALDVETSARLGLIGDYRYALDRDFHGKFGASYFNEAIRGDADESSTATDDEPHVPENRWSVQSEHTQQLASTEAYVDLQLVGDDLFFREINTYAFGRRQDVALRTLPFTTSKAGFVKGWNRAFLQGQGTFYQDLVENDSDETLQRVPDLLLTAQKQFGAYFLTDIQTSMSNFQREKDFDGFRADVRPAVGLRLPLGRSVYGSVGAAFRETAYALTETRGTVVQEDDGGNEVSIPVDFPTTQTREIVELGADVGTGVSRVFDFPHLGFDKLKHTIEPRVEYLFIPDVSQDDIPQFDGMDRVSQRNLLTYGFATRLLARTTDAETDDKDEEEVGDVYELTRLSIAQSYDFERDVRSIVGSRTKNHFSDIDVAVRVSPVRATSILATSTFDTGSAGFSSATVGLRLRDPRKLPEAPRLVTRPSFSFAYRFIRDNRLETRDPDESDEVQQLDSALIVPVTQRLGFLYATRYDLRNKRFFENHAGIRIISACDCWGIDLGFTDRSNPNELEFKAQLTLVGLGAFGTGTLFD
jgi:LPS-assembly protein